MAKRKTEGEGEIQINVRATNRLKERIEERVEKAKRQWPELDISFNAFVIRAIEAALRKK